MGPAGGKLCRQVSVLEGSSPSGIRSGPDQGVKRKLGKIWGGGGVGLLGYITDRGLAII